MLCPAHDGVDEMTIETNAGDLEGQVGELQAEVRELRSELAALVERLSGVGALLSLPALGSAGRIVAVHGDEGVLPGAIERGVASDGGLDVGR